LPTHLFSVGRLDGMESGSSVVVGPCQKHFFFCVPDPEIISANFKGNVANTFSDIVFFIAS